MVRSAIADDFLLTYLHSLTTKNVYAVGLVLGQTFSGKDYIVHFSRTPALETSQEPNQKQSEKALENIIEINESLVADHARQVTRMLPGGTHVLGIFVISPEDILSPFHAKLKSTLHTLHKLLDASKYLYGNSSSEKLIVNFNSKTLKYSCKAYDVLSHNVQPVDFKFLNKPVIWKSVESALDIDYLRYLTQTDSDWPLQKHIDNILDDIHDSFKSAIYFFDGEYKEADDILDGMEKKKLKGGKQTKSPQEFTKHGKAVTATIYQSMNSFSRHEITETSGQLKIIGKVACKIWLQPKVTIQEVSKAIMEDIMRSLVARLEMHWDSLTEEENSEGINCVHEPPRRVLIELPNSNITLSDYLFPGEGPDDAKTSLEELLDIEINGKLKIEDIEGQVDISRYDSALESDSDESLPSKFSKDGNKLLYVGIFIGLIVLVLAILLQLIK